MSALMRADVQTGMDEALRLLERACADLREAKSPDTFNIPSMQAVERAWIQTVMAQRGLEICVQRIDEARI